MAVGEREGSCRGDGEGHLVDEELEKIEVDQRKHALQQHIEHPQPEGAGIAAMHHKERFPEVFHLMYIVLTVSEPRWSLMCWRRLSRRLNISWRRAAEEKGLKLYYPSLRLCTDNGAMIASAGYFEYINGTRNGLDLNACPSLKL